MTVKKDKVRVTVTMDRDIYDDLKSKADRLGGICSLSSLVYRYFLFAYNSITLDRDPEPDRQVLIAIDKIPF